MDDERSRKAIDVAERFLVGMASDEQRELAEIAARVACDEACEIEKRRSASSEGYSRRISGERMGAAIAVWALVHGYTQSIIGKVRDALWFHEDIQAKAGLDLLWSEMAQSLRDIFGNPFRPVTLDPSWLTSTVISLARQMYDYRDFSAMPILADALQDAGCDSAEILDHCRGPGPHVRGCFLMDLILNKS